MVTAAENERLAYVGRGTPGGEFMRRYWQPALLSSELSENDGAPLRVRLLGEDLIAFRDTQGKVGLVDAYCPHRRAPLFFGRNEECGIRCVYHGWKFDRADVPPLDGHVWVPIDDEQTFVYNWTCAYDADTPITREYWEDWEAFCGRAPGAIIDRSKEFPGSSDRAVVLARRLLLESIAAVERGEEPLDVDPAASENVGACDGLLPANANWQEEFAGEMVARW